MAKGPEAGRRAGVRMRTARPWCLDTPSVRAGGPGPRRASRGSARAHSFAPLGRPVAGRADAVLSHPQHPYHPQHPQIGTARREDR